MLRELLTVLESGWSSGTTLLERLDNYWMIGQYQCEIVDLLLA